MSAPTETVSVGQTTSARAVAVMSDGTRAPFPAGTQFLFTRGDPTVASISNPVQSGNDTADLTGTRGGAITDIRCSITLPDGKTKLNTVQPLPQLMVFDHPAAAPTITGVEIRFE